MMCTCTVVNLPLHPGCIAAHMNENTTATHITMPLIFSNFNSDLPQEITMLLYKEGLSDSILEQS